MSDEVVFEAVLNNIWESTPPILVSNFSLQEEYASGWSGHAVLIAGGSTLLSLGQMLGIVLQAGLDVGRPTALQLVVVTYDEEDNPEGRAVRTWPCMVAFLEPFHSVDMAYGGSCRLSLVDPITYLSTQPIWGAYRACSIGEMIGGAISMAGGGDGKPSLEPLVPGIPRINIVEDVRDRLKKLPYSIATGQTLGEWIGETLSELGVRASLRGRPDGVVELLLSDKYPGGTQLPMTVLSSSPYEWAEQPSTSTAGPIYISGYTAYPGMPARAAVLDNSIYGSPLHVGSPAGAVETVFTGIEADLMEAQSRTFYPLLGDFTEMLRVSAMSRQPALRPGKTVYLSRSIQTIRVWQVARAAHHLRGGVYDNDVTLLNGELPWHPPIPSRRTPFYVTGMVDAGNEYTLGVSVPRDRLGRIHVTFPFLPTPTGEEARRLRVSDSDDDGLITIGDFDAEAIADYTDNEDTWETAKDDYLAGAFDDPFPGQLDEELTDDELTRRQNMKAKREGAIGYTAYLRAKELDEADRDQDNYVSQRDQLISDELSELLESEEEQEKIKSQWEKFKARQEAEAAGEEIEVDEDEEEEEIDSERQELIEEYGLLFEDDIDPSDPDATEEEIDAYQARLDADLATELWPPRLPLTVAEPMAGHLHGFIPAHRQGDVCRVAVYSPFSAEIIGFQYRSNRLINPDITNAIAGMVVEHNMENAWSGFVFRRVIKEEEDEEEDDEDEGEEGEEQAAQQEES